MIELKQWTYQKKLCKEANGQFCPLLTPLQPLTNPPSCIAALYTKNSREINRLCELTTKAQLEIYLPIPLAPNVWAIISSPFRQQPPVTIICPTKPAALIHISPPIHVLKLEPACSATSQHYHLPPKYEDTHITMNFSLYNANLDVIDISSASFRIAQHIPSVQQHKMLEKLVALPPVPIKRITMELMGEVLQETLSSDKPFWLHPSFLMGCIRFVASIHFNSSLHHEEEGSSLETTCPTRVLSLYVGRTRITLKWMMRIWTDPYTDPVASYRPL